MSRQSSYHVPRIMSLVIAVFITITAAVSSAPLRRLLAADQPLSIIASATGPDVSRLVLLDQAPLALLNGQHLMRYKAIDSDTGEIVSVTFDGGRVINEPLERAVAAAQWRAQHGALTPALVHQLSTLRLDSTLNVVVWLKASVRAPALPDYRPSTADHRSVLAMNQAEIFKARNVAVLKDQLAPIQSRFLAQLGARGIAARYASDIAPLIYLANLTRRQVEDLARLPDIDAIYPVPRNSGPALNVARPAQNANLINSVGYNGAGVKVSVTEGQRAYGLNPFLSIAAFYDATQPAEAHPTGVAGIIRSTNVPYTGLANGVTLYNANGSVSDLGVMIAAIDWGAITATVVNNSWYWDAGDATFTALDRHMDYLVRYNTNFIVGAAGNFGNGCQNPIGFTTPYVTSPAKGYNVITIGNYDEHGTLGWADDTMEPCSGFGDPGADITGTVHAKPEVAAIGTNITSTVISTNTATAVGQLSPATGTSYATPMVSALAADLIQADPNLATRPEALRSIIMATALHNIEGDSRFSDKDGAGGIDATAAIATVERGNWDSREISDTTTFPITFTQFVYKGERARFIINWLANPTSDYLTTSLPVDLDLTALRADSATVITTSASLNNNFEVVEFVAPASETYQFRVTRAGAWTGDSTRLGSAWWRGLDRLLPDTGYVRSKATPLGHHFAVYPLDWTPADRWRAFGVRSIGSTHDLELYSRAWFDDPGPRVKLAESHAVTGSVNIIVVDGNHWPAANQEQYVVRHVDGNGGYAVSWSNLGQNLVGLGSTGPYTLTQNEVVKVFDAYFDANQLRQIALVPTANNQSDLGLMLFKSVAANPATWVGARGGQVAKADTSTLPSATETLRYTHAFTTADDLGLVAFSNSTAPAEFYLRVTLDQVISFNPITNTVFGAPPFSITATASSGLKVTFTSSTLTCAVTPDGIVTIVSAGFCTIIAAQPGNDGYNTAQATQTFTIAKAAQVITFGPLPNKVFGDPPFVVTATASSTLLVTFTSLSPDCSVNAGAVVTLLGAGTCTLAAHQAGNANYQAAPTVTQTFTIARAPQSITFQPAAELDYSLKPLPITATASSGLIVTITTTSTACVALPNGDVMSIQVGECTLTAHQAGNANFLRAPDVTRTISIIRAAQTINFAPIANKALSDSPFVITATATSGQVVTFTTSSAVCAVSLDGVVNLSEQGLCAIMAHQAGNDLFYPAPAVEQSFSIGHLVYLPVTFKR